MMSKNSFLASLKENNKRRIWLWILSVLFWFIYYPVGMMMVLSRCENNNRIRGLTEKMARERLLAEAGNWLNIDASGFLILISLIAIVCAIQGFAYLYHRRKVDFYHSMPVKKSKRFAAIYVNGLLIFLLPYLLNLLLAMAVAGVNGAMDGQNVTRALNGMLATVILFLGTYGLTIVAVMMTGNLIITVLATIIFLVYEVVIRGILISYSGAFYEYFCYQSIEEIPVISPLGQLLNIMGDETWRVNLPYVVKGLALAVVFTGIGWFCYKKRPAEAAGKAMAFAKTKGVIKVLLIIPFSLSTGLFVMDEIGDMPIAMMVFGMVMAVIIGSCVIEVIYEMDIKAVFRKKYQMLISGACVAVIFLIFFFDLTGFDKWLPNPAKLKEAVVIIEDDRYNSAYVDADFNYIGTMDYFLSKPGISDIDAICQLSERKMKIGEEEGEGFFCTMVYRMKSGKEVWRNFWVSSENEELLNRIVGSREYKEAKFQLYDDAIYARIKELDVSSFSFSTGFRKENLALGKLDEFREAYLKDLEKRDYSLLKNEVMCGRVSLEIKKEIEKGTLERSFGYNIYPSYTNTIAFLTEQGVYDGMYLDMDAVAGITVTNYHYEQRRADREAGIEDYTDIYTVSKTFRGEEQIKELVPALYPTLFSTYWKPNDFLGNDYEVSIEYKDGLTDTSYYRGNNRAGLMTDLIPAWLEKETAYQ